MTAKWEGKSLVGGRLGQFEVKDEIARGGMGVVYKGYQPSLDRWVAIKTLPLDLAGDRDLVARFQREAEAMVRLNHANIVQIIDRGEDTGQYYFAMEYVEGPSVKDLLKSETIDKDKIFDILIQTCEGLEYAHKKGLVHRDIKPANLLFEEKTGTVKIADFGIAHFSKKDEDMLTLTGKDVGMGTMNYMAPEQKQDAGSVDHRADVYALGVIVYEAFTGKLPLGNFKLPSKVNPKLPRQLDAIVQKCLEFDAKDRYETCAVLKTALLEAKASTHDQTLQRSMREAFDRTLTAFGPNKGVGCGVLALLLVLVLGGVGTAAVFLLKGRSGRAHLERATTRVEKSRARALALHADADNKAWTDGESGRAKASDVANADDKATALELAADRFDEASSTVVAARKKDVADLASAIDGLKARAGTDRLGSDARAKLVAAEEVTRAASEALARADKPDGSLEALDLAPARKALDEARVLVESSEKLAQQEDAIRKKLEKVAPDSPERAETEKALAELKKARETGDVAGAFTALAAADKAASKGTNTQPVDTSVPVAAPSPSPTPVATATMDPGTDTLALSHQAAADTAASTERHTAERVIDAAKRAEVTAGAAELEAGSAAQKDAAALKPLEATRKLEEAAASFRAAAAKALEGLDQKREQARKAAEPGVGRPEYLDAATLDADLKSEIDPIERARLSLKQISKFNEVARLALEAGRKAVQELQGGAEVARERALLRLGANGQTCLAAADATLERGKDALKGNQIDTATTELKSAAAQFAAASWPTPRGIALASPGVTMAGSLKVLTDDGGGIESITGCPAGFVVSFKTNLYCYDLKFQSAAPKATAPGPISALCSGEGDEVFVATLSPPSVLRYVVSNGAIKHGAPLPGDLGQALPAPAYALAYDARTRQLFMASREKSVRRYDVTTGMEKEKAVAIDSSNIGIPFSLAVLSDGSFVVSGDADSKMPSAEKDFTFVAARYLANGDLDGVCNRGTSAVASAGDGLVVLEHAEKGQMWICPDPAKDLAGAVNGALALDKDAKSVAFGKWATKLAVFGQKAFVLDFPFDNADTAYRPWRTRVKIYDLK